MTVIQIQRRYNRTTAADVVWVGFARQGKLYKAEFTHLPRKYMRLTHASSARGGYAKIKVYIPTAECDKLIRRGKAVCVGKEEDLYLDPSHNRGENFERIITEMYTDEKWVKDSVPYWVAGDIEYNGLQVQIKFVGAELTNERTLANNFGYAL